MRHKPPHVTTMAPGHRRGLILAGALFLLALALWLAAASGGILLARLGSLILVAHVPLLPVASPVLQPVGWHTVLPATIRLGVALAVGCGVIFARAWGWLTFAVMGVAAVAMFVFWNQQ